jgi:hypothetical protein
MNRRSASFTLITALLLACTVLAGVAFAQEYPQITNAKPMYTARLKSSPSAATATMQ